MLDRTLERVLAANYHDLPATDTLEMCGMRCVRVRDGELAKGDLIRHTNAALDAYTVWEVVNPRVSVRGLPLYRGSTLALAVEIDSDLSALYSETVAFPTYVKGESFDAALSVWRPLDEDRLRVERTGFLQEPDAILALARGEPARRYLASKHVTERLELSRRPLGVLRRLVKMFGRTAG